MDVENIRQAITHSRRLNLLDHLELFLVVVEDDTRSHDDEQLGSLFGLAVESEKGSCNRDIRQPWNSSRTRGSILRDQTAKDNRLSVVRSDSGLSDRLADNRRFDDRSIYV